VSSEMVLQKPSLKYPVIGSVQHGISGSPKILSSIELNVKVFFKKQTFAT